MGEATGLACNARQASWCGMHKKYPPQKNIHGYFRHKNLCPVIPCYAPHNSNQYNAHVCCWSMFFMQHICYCICMCVFIINLLFIVFVIKY